MVLDWVVIQGVSTNPFIYLHKLANWEGKFFFIPFCMLSRCLEICNFVRPKSSLSKGLASLRTHCGDVVWGRIMGLLGSLNIVLMGDLGGHEECARPDTKVKRRDGRIGACHMGIRAWTSTRKERAEACVMLYIVDHWGPKNKKKVRGVSREKRDRARL